MKIKQVVFFVEHGWQAQRECSLMLNENEVRNICVIKGKLSSDLLGCITKHRFIRILPFYRKLYRLSVICFVVWFGIRGRISAVVADNKKMLALLNPFIEAFGVQSYIIRDEPEGFAVYSGDSRLEKSEFVTRVKNSAAV